MGKVQAIELDPRDVRNILIRISVGSAVPVTRGTTAKLGYQGVTGIAHILLEDSGADQVPLRSVDGEPARIAMHSSLIEELSDAGGATLRQARDFLANANQMIDSENRQHLATILANLEATTANTNAVARELKRVLAADNQRLLNATLVHTEQAAAEAGPLLVESRQLMTRLQLVSDKLDLLLGEPSPGGIGALVARFNEVGSGLARNSRQLDRVLQVLEESPQSLISGLYRRSRDLARPALLFRQVARGHHEELADVSGCLLSRGVRRQRSQRVAHRSLRLRAATPTPARR